MTAFHIKLIAIITMVIDHIGLFFFPDNLEFRLIGRLSFPLFAWLIANGAYYTRDIKGYLVRLLVLAFIAQIPFYLATHHRDPSFSDLNVVFTLFLGLSAIFIIKKTKNRLVWILATLICALAAHYIKADYGAMGVFSIVAFFVFFKNIKHMILSQVVIFTVPYFAAQQLYWISALRVTAIFSLFFICFYNKKEGPKVKYLFYVFYPLQYLVIYLIQLFL